MLPRIRVDMALNVPHERETVDRDHPGRPGHPPPMTAPTAVAADDRLDDERSARCPERAEHEIKTDDARRADLEPPREQIHSRHIPRHPEPNPTHHQERLDHRKAAQ